MQHERSSSSSQTSFVPCARESQAIPTTASNAKNLRYPIPRPIIRLSVPILHGLYDDAEILEAHDFDLPARVDIGHVSDLAS